MLAQPSSQKQKLLSLLTSDHARAFISLYIENILSLFFRLLKHARAAFISKRCHIPTVFATPGRGGRGGRGGGRGGKAVFEAECASVDNG
jgi:hypothetical protein